MIETRVILAVTNDLISDQRIHRIASSLVKPGNKVSVVGSRFYDTQPLSNRSYSTTRFRILFSKKVFFYAEFTIRLFFYLLINKVDIIVANDLDTLLACFLISKIKKVKLIYDSHEYFTEVPELINRKFVQRVWLSIEKLVLPRLKFAYTVNESLARVYKEKYKLIMHVFRNLPYYVDFKEQIPEKFKLERANKHLILYQGSLNAGRGIELMIGAMLFLPGYRFIIAGDGYLKNSLKSLVNELQLNQNVVFLGRIPFENLHFYTQQADLGISLEQNMGLNYFYALPNKLFDYIQARVPVLTSDHPEMKGIVKKYEIGMTTNINNPEKLAQLIRDIFSNQQLLAGWHNNLQKAADELCWEKEEVKLLNFYKNVIESAK